MALMPRPFRLRVLDKLEELIKTVAPANGDWDDLSVDGAVVQGRLFIGDDEPVPMVSMVEPPAAIEGIKTQPNNVNHVGEWDILIQGWAKTDLKSRNVTGPAYVLAAEVRRKLAIEKKKPSAPGQGQNHLGFGARIQDMRIGAPVVRPPDETSSKACFYLMLTLQIAEDMSDPFS